MDKEDKDRLKRLEAGQGYLTSDVNTLKSDVNTLKSDANTLKSDVKTLKSDVKTLKSDVESLKEGQRALKSEFGAKMDGHFKELFRFLNEREERSERLMAVLIEDYDSKQARRGEGLRANRDRLDDHEGRIQKLEDGAA